MKNNTAQILTNLYGLMMDINYHREDLDVLNDLKTKPDTFVEDHLTRIKRAIAKNKAAAQRQNIDLALDQLRQLKERGLEEIRKLLTTQEQAEYAQLFRKFEGLSKEDEASILEDKQLLKLLERIKESEDDNRA
jgi:hemerythrin superfamily protein